MKESWLLYDYLRRWWPWLLLVAVFGALAGLGFYSTQVHRTQYTATATVAIENPVSKSETPPVVSVSVRSTSQPTQEAAVAEVTAKLALIASYAEAPVSVRDSEISRRIGSHWWKSAVLGGVTAVLLVIGGIYVWEDARSYQRHRRQVGAANT